jgi:Neuraminidase (sialidase)
MLKVRASVKYGLLGAVTAVAIIVPVTVSAGGADPPFNLKKVHQDPFADGIGYHQSELEPSIAAAGKTIVSTFQVGRIYDGGASDIGFSTSTNGGQSWKRGELPLTVQGGGPSAPTTDAPYYPLTRGSDTVVAYNARYKDWIINTLGLNGNSDVAGVFVNLSNDGVNWSQPIPTHVTGPTADSPDKNWVTCDNWPTSRGYGNCYIEYDNNGNGNRLFMQVSTDGGFTWSATANTAPGNGNSGDVQGETFLSSPANPGDTNIKVDSVTNLAPGMTINVDIDPSGGNQETATITTVGTAGAAGTGVDLSAPLTRAHVAGAPLANTAATPTGTTGAIGGVPLVQPPPHNAPAGSTCGRVVVPYAGNGGLNYVTSSDCGAHWSARTQIRPNMTQTHTVAGQLRTSLLPMSAMDGAGAIYLTWQTRSFRVGSVNTTPNDIAMSIMPAPSTTTQYPPFGAPARIPIEADATTANPVDHFIPGIAADPNTSGNSAHLGLYYWFYPNAACVFANPGGNQCDLSAGYVSSTDGGQTWSSPKTLADMTLADVARTSQGPMVGDYSQAAVAPEGKNAGNAFSAFAVGLTENQLDESMYVPDGGLSIGGGPIHLAHAQKAAIEQAESAPMERHPAVPPFLGR